MLVAFTVRPAKEKLPQKEGFTWRSAGLEPATFSVRSQTHSRTGGDREGHRETKPRFYRNRALLKGQGRTGRDTGLWYRCGMKGERHSGIPSFSKTWGTKRAEAVRHPANL